MSKTVSIIIVGVPEVYYTSLYNKVYNIRSGGVDRLV